MEQIFKSSKEKFFNFLSYIKYVEGGKSSVPFLENRSGNFETGFKKPALFMPYNNSNNLNYYTILEDGLAFPFKPTLKEELKESARIFHDYRINGESMARDRINRRYSLKKSHKNRGGEITISFRIFNQIFDYIENESGIAVSYEKISSEYQDSSYKEQLLLPHQDKVSVWNKLKAVVSRKKIAKFYKVTIVDKKGNFISIKAYFWFADGKIPVVSFVERSMKEKNGDILYFTMLDSIVKIGPHGRVIKNEYHSVDTIIADMPLIDVFVLLNQKQKHYLYIKKLVSLLYKIDNSILSEKKRLEYRDKLKSDSISNEDFEKILLFLKKEVVQ